MTTGGSMRGISVAIERFCISTVVGVTQSSTRDKMTQNYTHALYQCQGPGFDIVR